MNVAYLNLTMGQKNRMVNILKQVGVSIIANENSICLSLETNSKYVAKILELAEAGDQEALKEIPYLIGTTPEELKVLAFLQEPKKKYKIVDFKYKKEGRYYVQDETVPERTVYKDSKTPKIAMYERMVEIMMEQHHELYEKLYLDVPPDQWGILRDCLSDRDHGIQIYIMVDKNINVWLDRCSVHKEWTK